MRLLLPCLLGLLVAGISYAQEPIQADLCSVLSQPLQFNGRMIAVRGTAHSFHDGLVVSSDTCLKRLILDRVTFRNEIAVEEAAGGETPFITDKTSFAKLSSVLAALDPETQYVSATFVGLFETRVPLGSLVLGHGLTDGYGYMGRLPGRLILREVRSIAVVSKPEAPRLHTVCELLADPLAFNGQLVAVRVAVHSHQGLWLLDGHCSSHIIVRGHTFENVIAVADPTVPTRLHDVPFDRDDQSCAQVMKDFGESDAVYPEVFATFVGVFETREHLNLVAPNGASWGFGHLGEAPAQLLLKECRNVTTEYAPIRSSEPVPPLR